LGVLACTLAALLLGTAPGAKHMDTVVQGDAVSRRIVRFERQDAGTRAWTPVHTYGVACAPQQPEMFTDGAGVVTSLAPWTGPASYRMSWLRPDGAWVPGVPIDTGP
jgi:hypothetical protein